MINYLYQQLSLTGCDTVGKVGTKLSLLNTMETDEDLLQYFGKDRLDSDAIADAEQFLVNVLSKKYGQSCISFNDVEGLNCTSMLTQKG